MATAAPVAKKLTHFNEYHGKKYQDDYHWLRDDKREHPDILAYLKEENAYADSVMEKWKPLQDTLYKEYLSRIQEDDETVPHKEVASDGSVYFYYTRTVKGQNYSLQCRKANSLEAEEEIILDLNLDKENKYISLGALEPSHSHNIIAVVIDYAGHEDYQIRFKELSTGKMLEDHIDDTTEDIVWSADDTEILYVKMDDSHRPYQVWRHKLGTASSEDQLIYEELDTKFNVGLSETASQQFAIISSQSSTTSEVHYLFTNDFSAKLTVIQPRVQNVLYRVTHYGDQFVIRTNGGGDPSHPESFKNFRLVTAPADGRGTGMDKWEQVFYDENVYVTGITPFKNFLVASERSGGSTRLRVFSPDGRITAHTPHKPVSFQEEDYSINLREQNYHDNVLRIQYTSWITPPTIIDITLADGEQEVKKENPVPNYSKAAYESKVIWSTSEDGAQVPVTLTYRKDLYKEDGTNPCLLYGYGSYGICMDPRFTVTLFSLLDRGFVYAVAKIRGGSEMGRSWYEDSGKFLTKMNTFTDFISAGRTLVKQKVTTHERMAISGASAGGLLVGAVLNLAPDLCKAYVSNVPFVDVINTMWDESIPLTTGEFEEWGNPKDEKYFEYMHSYSPYNNIKSGVKYPNGRVTAGLWDPRVAYWEPTKWVAKLRSEGVTNGGKADVDHNLLIYECQMNAGHFASTGRYDYLKDKAKDMAFIIGVVVPSKAQ